MNTRSTKAKTVHFVVDICDGLRSKQGTYWIILLTPDLERKNLQKGIFYSSKAQITEKSWKNSKLFNFNSQKEFLTTPKWHNCISPILSHKFSCSVPLQWPRFDPWKILQTGFEIFATRWSDRSFWWTMPIMDIKSNHQYATEKEPGCEKFAYSNLITFRTNSKQINNR